jgi:hypothetical protein
MKWKKNKTFDFVTEDDFRWTVNEAAQKKKQGFSKVEFVSVEEGLCIQCMQVGSGMLFEKNNLYPFTYKLYDGTAG